MKRYKRLNEEDVIDLNKVDNYLITKIDEKLFKKNKRKTDSGEEISYSYKDRNDNEYYYSIETYKDEVRLNFLEIVTILGDSLNDPKATYMKTSASYFKKKKKKLDKFYTDFNKIKKDIDKYFIKES